MCAALCQRVVRYSPRPVSLRTLLPVLFAWARCPVFTPSFSPTFWHAMIERAFSPPSPPPYIHGPFVSKAVDALYEVARALKDAQPRMPEEPQRWRESPVNVPAPSRLVLARRFLHLTLIVYSDYCCANFRSSHTSRVRTPPYTVCMRRLRAAYLELRNDLFFGCTHTQGRIDNAFIRLLLLFFILHPCRTGTRRIAASWR